MGWQPFHRDWLFYFSAIQQLQHLPKKTLTLLAAEPAKKMKFRQ